MEVKKEYILSNGVIIPSIGFGTWQIPEGEIVYQSTIEALNAGYRHIDTAAAYGNEYSIGKAISDFGIKREEVFITSKLKAEIKGYLEAKNEFHATLKRLGTTYLDLYLIHAPKPWGSNQDPIDFMDQNIESWKAFVELYHEGFIKAIGVSNFRPETIQPLIDATGFTPHVNQIYLCPGALQTETVDYAHSHQILIEAYSPFSTGRLFKSTDIHEMAKKYEKTAAQIALRWSLQKGHLPLPKSTTKERIVSNLEVYDFELSSNDMKRIDQIQIQY